MKKDHLNLDFVEDESHAFVPNLDNTTEIAKTLVAFANTNGGTLIVGAKSNKKMVGIFPSDEIEKLKSVSMNCNPLLVCKTEVQEIGFRLILIVQVKKTGTGPHFSVNTSGKKEAWIREGAQNLRANKLLLSSWKYKDENGCLPDVFSVQECRIIEIIKENPDISLTQIYKKSQFTIDTVDYSLVRLLNWNVIKMRIAENACFFNLQ